MVTRTRLYAWEARLWPVSPAEKDEVFREIVYCGQVFKKSPLQVKNFSIWLCYDSCNGTHNMYREYQDLTTVDAITQCYRDMGARHRAWVHSTQIMKVEEITASKSHRPAIKQFHDSKIKFLLPHQQSSPYTYSVASFYLSMLGFLQPPPTVPVTQCQMGNGLMLSCISDAELINRD
ncbi:hypothetical protein GH733_005625 [Mirounga leonina]|nr:hypothetical protein GH733_005625 [Mirounga leonina]